MSSQKSLLPALCGPLPSDQRSDVWLTPPTILDALGGYESFDLDPCAAPDPRPWSTAKCHYNELDDGLFLDWHGRVWLNPPYARAVIGQWMKRLVKHGSGTALIFARTDTSVFMRHVWDAADAVFFLSGRLHFHLPDGSRAEKQAGAPSVLCAYGSDDAEILSQCGLDGRFIPLRIRLSSHGADFENPRVARTWGEMLQEWMEKASGTVHLADIYRAFSSCEKARGNPNFEAKIRQELQIGPFRNVGRGLWKRDALQEPSDMSC